MSALTDRDLSRLLTLQYVHGGTMRSIPHGVNESFDALAKVGLVEIANDELQNGSVIPCEASITANGKRVVRVGMDAMINASEL